MEEAVLCFFVSCFARLRIVFNADKCWFWLYITVHYGERALWLLLTIPMTIHVMPC